MTAAFSASISCFRSVRASPRFWQSGGKPLHVMFARTMKSNPPRAVSRAHEGLEYYACHD